MYLHELKIAHGDLKGVRHYIPHGHFVSLTVLVD